MKKVQTVIALQEKKGQTVSALHNKNAKSNSTAWKKAQTVRGLHKKSANSNSTAYKKRKQWEHWMKKAQTVTVKVKVKNVRDMYRNGNN